MSNRIVANMEKRDDLKHYVKNRTNVIVKIGATWCGPCKRATPIFNENFLKLPSNVNLVMVDADKGNDICSALKVKSVPMYLYYKNGDCLEICNSTALKDIEYFFTQVKSHVKN